MQVQTIDRCQGDEADGVVLSLVMAYPGRGSPSYANTMFALSALSNIDEADQHATNFVQYENRANVAISRARYAVVVVKSNSLLAKMEACTLEQRASDVAHTTQSVSGNMMSSHSLWSGQQAPMPTGSAWREKKCTWKSLLHATWNSNTSKQAAFNRTCSSITMRFGLA
jgi:AAA domain